MIYDNSERVKQRFRVKTQRIAKTLNDSRKLFTLNFLLLTFNEENYTRITIAPEKDAT